MYLLLFIFDYFKCFTISFVYIYCLSFLVVCLFLFTEMVYFFYLILSCFNIFNYMYCLQKYKCNFFAYYTCILEFNTYYCLQKIAYNSKVKSLVLLAVFIETLNRLLLSRRQSAVKT